MAGSNNMRIALIGVTYPFRGGISHYTTLLCRALREKHEVRFFALKRQYPKVTPFINLKFDDERQDLNLKYESPASSG